MIGENADAPFFEKGELSSYAKNAVEFCNNFEAERQRTESFVKLLTDLDLFENKKAKFTAQNADGTPGEEQIIADYTGVSETKLNALSQEKLKELRDNGALAQIYCHLISLLGWDRLLVKAMLRPRIPVAANA